MTPLNRIYIYGGAILLWYSISTYLEFKKKGIDPSLITYRSPVRFYNDRFGIALGSLAATISIFHPFGIYITEAIFVFAAIHIFLLIIFGRIHTQPVFTHVLTALGATTIYIHLPYGPIWALACNITAYVYLKYWQKHAGTYYILWVRRLSLNIHDKFWQNMSPHTSELTWYCTLLVATTEAIARPKISRLLEHLYFVIKKPSRMSSGIMQVMDSNYLSDEKSVKKGCEIIEEIMANIPMTVKTDKEKITYIAQQYNGSTGYQVYLNAIYPGFQSAWAELKHRGLYDA